MIVSFEDLPMIREAHQQEDIVLAGGCFDIVHEGHVRGLEFCKSLGEILVVGISSDNRVRQRKGEGRPIRNELGRMLVVDAFKPVDYVFLLPEFEEGIPSPTIRSIDRLRPDIFADHIENKHRWEPSRRQIEAYGAVLCYNTTERPDSSTNIVNKILSLAEV